MTAESPSTRLHPSPLPPPRHINLRPEKIVTGQQGGAASVPHLSLGLAGASQPVTGRAVAEALITRISHLSLSVSDIHTHKSGHAGGRLTTAGRLPGGSDCNKTSTLRLVHTGRGSAVERRPLPFGAHINQRRGPNWMQSADHLPSRLTPRIYRFGVCPILCVN